MHPAQPWRSKEMAYANTEILRQVMEQIINQLYCYMPHAKTLARLRGTTAWIRYSTMANTICQSLEPLENAINMCSESSSYAHCASALQDNGLKLGVKGLLNWNEFEDSPLCIGEALFDSIQKRETLAIPHDRQSRYRNKPTSAAYDDGETPEWELMTPFAYAFPQMAHMVLYDNIRFSKDSRHDIIMRAWCEDIEDSAFYSTCEDYQLFQGETQDDTIKLEDVRRCPELEIVCRDPKQAVLCETHYLNTSGWAPRGSKTFEEWYAPYMAWCMKHNMNWRSLLPHVDIKNLLVAKGRELDLDYDTLNEAEKTVLRLNEVLKKNDPPADWRWDTFWHPHGEGNSYYGEQEKYSPDEISREREYLLKATAVLHGISAVYPKHI